MQDEQVTDVIKGPLCVKCAFVDSRAKKEKKREKKPVEVRMTELDPRHRAMLGIIVDRFYILSIY